MGIGLAVIGLGVAMTVSDMASWAGTTIQYACFAFGGFILILAVLALYGARKNKLNKCALYLYSGLLFVMVAAQIGVVCVILLSEDNAKEFLGDRWDDMSAEERNKIMEEY